MFYNVALRYKIVSPLYDVRVRCSFFLFKILLKKVLKKVFFYLLILSCDNTTSITSSSCDDY